jgi:hypothetical protein
MTRIIGVGDRKVFEVEEARIGTEMIGIQEMTETGEDTEMKNQDIEIQGDPIEDDHLIGMTIGDDILEDTKREGIQEDIAEEVIMTDVSPFCTK